MACRDAYLKKMNINKTEKTEVATMQSEETQAEVILPIEKLLFGTDSAVSAHDILQNNLTEFEWVTRNKLYPNFWGRNIAGENSLTKEEIDFLHDQGCKIAAIYQTPEEKETEEQGRLHAKKAGLLALELGIPGDKGIFLEIPEEEKVTAEYMQGFIQGLIEEGYIPGFMANTDAKYVFDREYSRGMKNDRELFVQSLIWATSPNLKEYEGITTSHLIHPDSWVPHAPSGITRKEIAIWQYGKNCHPIMDDAGNETVFHVDLVKNPQIVIEKMF